MSVVKKKLIYEQPLNERIRTWLRLEYLFSLAQNRCKGNTAWDSRAAMTALLEILDFLARHDCKKLLIKELESRCERMLAWRHNARVDLAKLEYLLEKVDKLIARLHHQAGDVGKELGEQHLLAKVRQRDAIPGGTCPFDIPVYHHWLQKSSKERQADLLEWWQALSVFWEALELNLYLLRNHAATSMEVAQRGIFQGNITGGNGFQMVRILLPEDTAMFPEVSGGAHRFTIRFYEYYNVASRPTQTERDVEFELCCCFA